MKEHFLDFERPLAEIIEKIEALQAASNEDPELLGQIEKLRKEEEKLKNKIFSKLSTWQKVININVTSSYVLTKYLVPLMEGSKNPRIIFTSSGVAEKGRAYWGAYAVSKAAVKSLAEILQEELEPISQIRIFNFDPGKTKTAMRAFAYPAENPNDLKDASSLLPYYLWMLSEQSDETNERYIKFD